ncbi:MAG: DNA repair protein RecN [Alphaproteobacteria bacterium]
MLSSLTIKDVVLIDKLSLNFSDGLSVLTGETGAGKSILLDALGLAIGARGEATLVRKGIDQLTVTAMFDIPNSHYVFKILKELDIEAVDGELVLRRIVSSDGRSKAYINDQPVSIKALKDIGTSLVEIHGQFETYGLLNPATHRKLLDEFGNIKSFVDSCKDAFSFWHNLKKERNLAESNQQKAKEDEDFLLHSIEELEKLAPKSKEENELAEKRSLLMNAEKIIEALNGAYNIIAGQNNITSTLQKAENIIDRLNNEKFRPIVEALERAAIETEEAVNLLEAASSDVDLDPRYLEEVEERLFTLKAIARKHSVEVDGLCDLLQKFKSQLELIDGGEGILSKLRKAEEEARSNFMKQAKILSDKRKEAAKKLSKAVNLELPPLKLEKANFEIMIEDLEEAEWGEYGRDKVSFMVSTNPGAPFMPMIKIASGGELARLTLALKVNLATSGGMGTIVFDEVDSGIGGAAAAAVGERLAKLAETMQVLVVTHSPQVASVGNTHFRVDKKLQNSDKVITTVITLDDGNRQEEIARMLAGAKITDEARAAAKALISNNNG